MSQKQSYGIKAWLEGASSPLFILYATGAAFMTYFSMYAFRKPGAVGTFMSVEGWDYQIDYKTAIILAQVIGYALSKWLGIKVISEMSKQRRAVAILLLVCLSEVALIMFAVLPPQFGVVALFLNGVPLGMIWGLVFSYLEGRRTSEILGVGLCTSFIFSSGAVKSIGKYLMLDWGVSEMWMPAVTGALFIAPLFLFVFLLSQIPDPTDADVADRQKRVPMDSASRKAFFIKYAVGLSLLVATYVLLTAFRDFRDIFAAEIWIALGYGGAPEMFTVSEIPSSVGILVVLGAMMFIRNNLLAFKVYHGLIILGLASLGLSTLAYQSGAIGGVAWMMILSMGLYLAYIPFNCILFDRLMAVSKSMGNAGFLIYVADSSGYLGSVGLLLYKSLMVQDIAWLPFLQDFSLITAVAGCVLIAISFVYFSEKLADRQLLIMPKVRV